MKKRALFIFLSFILTVSFLTPKENAQAGHTAASAYMSSGDLQPFAYYATAISGAGNFTCVLTAFGGSATGSGIRCWGDNGYGQLGDGTITERHSPVDVIGLTNGVSAVVVGDDHACALTSTGGVKCWGSNHLGQLGIGTSATKSLVPMDVVGLTSGVRALSSNGNDTCALTDAGGIKCWGANNYGQLGDGTSLQRNTPVDVSDLTSGAMAVAAGRSHTCALMMAGGVKCWGDNASGQLGDGTTTQRLTPVDVVGLSSGIRAITVGAHHTCVLTTGSFPMCWGTNSHGQVGNGSVLDRYTPTAVSGLENISALEADGNHTCAITSGGGLKCWGSGTNGQLGDGWKDTRRTPVDVNGLTSGVYAVAAGPSHTCALTTSGGVKCWGSNIQGQLGDGTINDHLTPTNIYNLVGSAVAVSSGRGHSCALTIAGGGKCWGNNFYGEIGDGSMADERLTPVDVYNLTSGLSAIVAGGDQTCALTTAGGVKCWGENAFGQLGNNTNTKSNIPVDVYGLSSGVSAITVGGDHVCALTVSGGVKCWGWNSQGQLGNNTTTNSNIPIDVFGLSNGVSAIAAGEYHTCALMTEGGVQCWGANYNHQLGNNSSIDSYTPVNVIGLSSSVSAIAVGGSHNCALLDTGGVQCWGANGGGQLGNGYRTDKGTPVDVKNLNGEVVKLTAGNGHTCALMATNGILCWGSNYAGVLGINDDNYSYSLTPVTASGLSRGVVAIDAGSLHNCVLTQGGGVRCWGANEDGRLGDGKNWTHSYSHVQAAGLISPTFPLATLSANPTVYGQPVKFSATIKGATIFPVGSVQFQIDGVNLGSPAGLSEGMAVSSNTTSGAGLHVIQAHYNGDSSYTSGWTAGVLQVVQPADTLTTLTSTANPSKVGQPVTLTAMVVSAYGGATTGTVAFKDGGTVIAGCESVSLSGGQATCNTTFASLGGHTLTAEYGGDANNLASVSTELVQTVNRRETTTTLSASVNPSKVGQEVTFNATVVSPYGTPAGTVAFKDGNTTIVGCENVVLSEGQAACSISALELGAHTITADYTGDTNDKASSGSHQQTVMADTSTHLVTSLNPSATGDTVTFTATVDSLYGIPTGVATFKDNGATIDGCADVSLVNGQAACATASLTAGTHTLTAEYGGDDTFNASTSAGLSQHVFDPGSLPPITILSVTKQDPGILVSWKMVYNANITGFNVYRRSEGGSFVRVNDTVIPTQSTGNPADEVPYTLTDTQFQNGLIYEYQVEGELVNGGSNWSVITRVDTRFRSYLPMIGR